MRGRGSGRLVARAPVGRAAADRVPLELGATARAVAAAASGLDEAAGVDAAEADRVAGGRADGAAQGVELLGRELSGGDPWAEPGAPERLVREQVADPRDHALVEQLGLQGDAAAAGPRAELVARDLRGVGAYVREVGLDHGPAETTLVVQRHPPAVGELQYEAVPRVRRGRLVDADPAGHAEVQADVGAVIVRLRPQELAAPVRARDRPADQRRRDLSRRVGTAHVRVAVVDCDDLAPDRPLELLARAFGLGELRHTRAGYESPANAARRGRAGPRAPGRSERGAAVVEPAHRHGALRRGVDAQPAEHALVEVLLDDPQPAVLHGEDVDRTDLGELGRHGRVRGRFGRHLDVDEEVHTAAPFRSAIPCLTRSGMSSIRSATV